MNDLPPAASDSAAAEPAWSRLAELRGAERWAAAQRAATDPSVEPLVPRKPVQFRTKPSLDFSLIGLIYISMMIFMGLAAMNSQANLLFGVFGLMIGVLLVSGVISRWVLRHVEVRRILPDHTAVGEPVRILYDIDNRKRWWPTLSLLIAELDSSTAFDRQPHSYVMHAAAGSSARVAADVVPMRRGLHRLERFQLSTSFPFGFIKRAIIRRQPDSILVHPAQGAVNPKAISRFLSAESTGINQRPREGGYDEFFGVREYRPGDTPHMVHWRRTARASATATPSNPHGTLVVKQMTRVSPPRLMLFVDTYVPPGAADAPPTEDRLQQLAAVERNLAVAASLISAATLKGLQVGLVVWNGSESRNGDSRATVPDRMQDVESDARALASGWIDIRPERGKRHRLDLLSILAILPRNETADAAAVLARGRPLLASDTTGILIASGSADGAGDASPGRALQGRGNIVTIDTGSARLDGWVLFSKSLDFAEMAGVSASTGHPSHRK